MLHRDMRNNRATKKEAVAIIRRAVKDGWSREVDVMRYENKPWNVMVSLAKTLYFPNNYVNYGGPYYGEFPAWP